MFACLCRWTIYCRRPWKYALLKASYKAWELFIYVMHCSTTSFFHRICFSLMPVPGSGTPCSLIPGPLNVSMFVFPHPFWHTQGTWHPAEWKLFLSSPLELMGGRLHLPVHPAFANCCVNLHPHTTLTDAEFLSMGTPCTAWPKSHSGLTSNVDAATLLADQPLRVNNPHISQDLSWSALNPSLREKEFLENLESCQKRWGRTQNATAWLRQLDEKTLPKYKKRKEINN